MVISSPCLTDIKNWLVQSKRLLLASPKQTALGKDFSNPLIVDSLLKTIWLSMHHVVTMKHWLFQSKRLLVGQSSGSVPEPERPERVLALRQPTLTTRIDPEDGRAYIDVHAYPPPAPPVQTPPSPEWSSGLLPVSPTPSIIPSPISSPMIPLTVPSLIASPVTAEAEEFLTEYDRDLGELFTRSGAVRDETFSQRYRFRSQTDAQRVALWHAISDTQTKNQELRLQIAEERHARLYFAEIVDSMRRGQEPRGDV
ncbi:hypothetical protein Tco_0869623 [Tanacetum coccineum]